MRMREAVKLSSRDLIRLKATGEVFRVTGVVAVKRTPPYHGSLPKAYALVYAIQLGSRTGGLGGVAAYLETHHRNIEKV